MKKTLLFLLISNLIWAQWSISNNQRNALINLYNTSNGPSWNRTWDLDKDPRYWFGIVIKNGEVVEISLNNNALKGVFPNNLAPFDHLQKLDISNNQLNGDVSSNLTSLTQLKELNISNNHLGGDPSIPLGTLKQLSLLDIGGNNFDIENVGALLNNFNGLKSLGLSSLNLTEIPEKIAQLPNLEDLNLSNNHIKQGFDRLSPILTLETLNLSDNQLSQLPASVKGLHKLVTLDLSNNAISNFEDLINLNHLEQLNIGGNNLTEIPNSIGSIKNLIHLNLDYNKINSGLSKLISLKKLQQLSINHNEIRGAFPTEVLQIPSLLMLSIRDNHLEGTLPNILPSICDISNNRFTRHNIVQHFQSAHFNYDGFYYSPQRYDYPDEVLGVIGQPAVLHQQLSGPDYSFAWFKNLDEPNAVTQESYFINTVENSDYAFYTTEAFTYDTIFGNNFRLSLFREPIKLTNKLGVNDPLFKISIYPNPTSDFINILSPNKPIESIRIYDLSGKQVITSQQQRINVSRLPSGVYLMNVKTSSNINTYKFIKQ